MKMATDFKQLAELHYSLYIYDDVKGDGYDWWSGETIPSETSANYFRDQLAAIPHNAKIDVYINSLGGSVLEGLSIRNQLYRHPADTTAYIDGFACSIASVIPTGCKKVVMYRNTMQMMHHAWTWASGNAVQLHKAADDIAKIDQGVCQSYLEKAGGKLTAETLQELLDRESWLTAQECLDYGLCDEIVEKDADLSGAMAMLERTKAAAAADARPAAAYTLRVAAQAMEKLSMQATPPAPIAPPTPPPAKAETSPPEPTPPENPAIARWSKLLAALAAADDR